MLFDQPHLITTPSTALCIHVVLIAHAQAQYRKGRQVTNNYWLQKHLLYMYTVETRGGHYYTHCTDTCDRPFWCRSPLYAINQSRNQWQFLALVKPSSLIFNENQAIKQVSDQGPKIGSIKFWSRSRVSVQCTYTSDHPLWKCHAVCMYVF